MKKVLLWTLGIGVFMYACLVAAYNLNIFPAYSAETDRAVETEASKCRVNSNELLSFINKERDSIGVQKLKLDPALVSSSKSKLNDMVTNRYFGHNLIDGSDDVSILRDHGINAATSENLDSNALNPKEDWESFKGSKDHYESLVNSEYTRVGVASKCTSYRTVKNTDNTDNLPVGSLISQLTVVHLAAPEQTTNYSPPTPTYSSPCPVTTCNDGTCSSSTGRGTCSWHGGIAY